MLEKQLKIRQKNKKVDLLTLVILGASLLGNLLTGKDVCANDAVTWPGEEVRVMCQGPRTNRIETNFNAVLSFD